MRCMGIVKILVSVLQNEHVGIVQCRVCVGVDATILFSQVAIHFGCSYRGELAMEDDDNVGIASSSLGGRSLQEIVFHFLRAVHVQCTSDVATLVFVFKSTIHDGVLANGVIEFAI